jgi:hypothetical protein
MQQMNRNQGAQFKVKELLSPELVHSSAAQIPIDTPNPNLKECLCNTAYQ